MQSNTAEVQLSKWAVEAMNYLPQDVGELPRMRGKRLRDMEDDLEMKTSSYGFQKRRSRMKSRKFPEAKEGRGS